jgi:hypothetical protein
VWSVTGTPRALHTHRDRIEEMGKNIHKEDIIKCCNYHSHTHLLGHNISYCPGEQHGSFLFLLSRGNWRKKLEERAKVKTGINQEVQAN